MRLRVPRTRSSNSNVSVEIEFAGDVFVPWKQDAGEDTGNVTFQAAKLEKLASAHLSGATLQAAVVSEPTSRRRVCDVTTTSGKSGSLRLLLCVKQRGRNRQRPQA